MAFDGIFISLLCAELKEKLTGAKVFKIYQPGDRQLTLEFRYGKDLFVSVSPEAPYFCLTDERKDNPVSPPNFCMLLRKHLNGAVVKDVAQDDLERTVALVFDSVNELGDSEEKRLFIEIMGKYCNIILTNGALKILGALKTDDGFSGNRAVMPGLIYQPITGKTKKSPSSLTDTDVFLTPRDIVDGVKGVSPAVAATLFQNPAPVKTQIETAISNAKPYLFFGPDGAPADFSYMPLCGKENCEICESYSDAVDRFYKSKTEKDLAAFRSGGLLRQINTVIDRIEKKNAKQEKELLESQNAETYRRYGDLLTSNLHLGRVRGPEIEVEDYYDNCKKVKIKLDESKDLKYNAAAYYKKYKKQKTAAVILQKCIDENAADLEYLKSVRFFVSECKNEAEIAEIRSELTEGGYLRKKKAVGRGSDRIRKSAPSEYTAPDGVRILVGRNNLQNDRLTFKTAKKDFLWLHVKNAPGSHTVIMAPAPDVSDATILYAATLAAKHSDSAGKTDVDYTLIKYVRRQPNGKPGMVFYTDYKTITVDASK